MSGPSWVGEASLIVHIGSVFSGFANVRDYGDYYFEIPKVTAIRQAGEWVPIDIEVQNDCTGGPDDRDIAVCLHGAGISNSSATNTDTEAIILNDQLSMIEGNPRFRELLSSLSSKGSSPIALEVGGGFGALSALVSASASATTWCIDTMDYGSTGGVPMRARLHGTLKRNEQSVIRRLGLKLEALTGVENRVIFHTCSAEKLPLRDNLFDIAFSLNAFEHIGNPRQALREIQRVLKPGGFAFIQFSPIYLSDAGSHLYDQGLSDVPWLHISNSRDQICSMIASQGRPTNRVDEILDSLNGHTTQYYREIFSTCDLEIMHIEEIRGCRIPGATDHDQFKVVSKMFPTDDLLVQGFKVLLRKRVWSKN